MGDINDVKDASSEIRSDSASTLQELGNVLGVLSNISGVVGGPMAVIGLLNLLMPRTDPVVVELQNLQRLMDAALHFQVVDDIEEHQFHVKDVTAPAETAWGTLNEVNFDTHSPLLTVDGLQHDTYGSLQTLTDPIYWHRPYYDQLDWDEGWIGKVIPPDILERLGPDLREVFDYRLVLPSFLYALFIRSTVVVALHALRPEIVTDAVFANIQTQELLPRAITLSSYYETIVAGFVSMRTPDATSMADLQVWESAGRVIGVIDSYAGSGLIDSAVPADWNNGTPAHGWSDPFDAEVFPVRYQLGIRQRWIALYLSTGLHGAWLALQNVRGLAAQTAAVARIDRRAAWSLKDVYGMLGTVLQDRPPPQFAPLSMSDTLHRLLKVAKAPYPDPTSLTPNLVSFRGSVSVAAF